MRAVSFLYSSSLSKVGWKFNPQGRDSREEFQWTLVSKENCYRVAEYPPGSLRKTFENVA